MHRKDFRILIADDDEIAREVVCTILSKEGYDVLCAKDGIEAIRLISIEEINLVITDLRMPGADGVEVLKYAVKNNPDIFVVILTAYGTLDTALEAIKEGAYDYLTKPFKIQEIIFLAERAFKKFELIKENRDLKKNLRETYRNIERAKRVSDSNRFNEKVSWLEDIERLKENGILTEQEVEIIKKRVEREDGKGQAINN